MKPFSPQKTHVFSVFVAVIILMLCAVRSFGVPLAVYREKITAARADLSSLLEHDAEIETVADMRKEEQKIFSRIRKDIQANFSVEAGREVFEVDHSFLLENISRLESLAPNSSEQRDLIVETTEKISAIEVKLNELERQTVATRTKDEDKQKLREILNRPEYGKPVEAEKSILEEMLDSFFKWLDSLFPKNLSTPDSSSVSVFSFAVQMLVYGAILAVIGYLLHRFAPFLRRKFQSRKDSDDKERIILGEKISADETAENLFEEAERLAREGNLRAAIRKGYIAFLCELGDRKILGLSKTKTNRDYLRDVRKLPALHQNMSLLTNRFERVWYGFNRVEPKDWENFREQYRQAVGGK